MNRRERVLAVFQNKVPDRTPACFCYHHSSQDTVKELVRKHWELYQQSGQDMIKVMYDLAYGDISPICKPSEWNRFVPLGKRSPRYQKQMDILKQIVEKAAGDCVVLNTTFGPMRHMVWLLGNSNDAMMEHLKQDPLSVKNGLRVLAEEMTEWMYGFLSTGIDGIFYAAQFGEPGRFSTSEWEEFVHPYDRMVLDSIRHHNGKVILLHPCGQPQYEHKVDLQRYLTYPKDMINWSVHANGLSLEAGRQMFQCPIMGGVDNQGAIAKHDPEGLRHEIEDIIRQTSPRGFLLGADCSLPGTDDSTIVRAAIEVLRTKGEERLLPG